MSKNINNRIINNKILIALLGLILLGRIIYLWHDNWKIISHPFNIKTVEDKYYKSQWFDPRSITPIDDEELYEYVGYALIKKGLGVFEANPEMPPLGKYIIGWMEINSGWSKLTGPAFSTIMLGLLLWLGLLAFKHPGTALIAVIAYSFQPLYFENFWRSHLDTMVQCFLIAGFILLHKGKYFWGILILGFLPGLKFSAFYFLLAFGFLVIYFIVKQKTNRLYYLPLLLLPLLVSYGQFFISGNTIFDWLKNEKWIIQFYLSSTATSPWYNPLTMLFCGWWKQWWGDLSWVRFREWNLIWPIFCLLTLVNLKKLITQKLLLILLIWLGIYLIALLTTIPTPKYFMLVLPFLYISALYTLENIIYRTIH